MRAFSMIVILVAAFATAGSAYAQVRNLESVPNGQGRVQGTYGSRNFDLNVQQDGVVSGQIGGQRPGVRSVRPAQTPGNVGATQSRCYAGENGNTFCE